MTGEFRPAAEATTQQVAERPAPPFAPAPAATAGMLPGASRMSKIYYDGQGRRCTAAVPVPIDQFGKVVGAEYECRRCDVTRWFSASLKGIPTCDACGRRMVALPIRKASLLPWRGLWDVAERPLRPVWALPAMAAAGYAMDRSAVPALVVAGALPVAGLLTRRVAAWQLVRVAIDKGRLDEDAPGFDRRIRAAIDRQARLVGYGAAAGTGWLALVAALGVDPSTTAGRIALAAMAAVWLVPAATWWWKRRQVQPEPEPEAVVVDDEPEAEPDGPLIDADEAQTRHRWTMYVAAKQGQPIGKDPKTGEIVAAPRNGKLVGARIEDWHRVDGGCAWTAVGVPGVHTAESFLGAKGAVASAFRMKKSMVTCIPDPEDEAQALYLAQRSSPIGDDVRWAGPDSICMETLTAPVARFIDGGLVPYEICRVNWGVPHVAAFGTTGSGKSEFLNLLFTIDRWAHRVDERGDKHGIVADFLIDPQQGQSFAPFLDDLAGPVATTLDEAMLLVQALTAEMLRRNRYLAREAKTWDEKRKKWRTGRKWWDPRIDGPILALTIDESHNYLSHKPFAKLVVDAGRMWRKCGGQLRIGTHTPLLGDLGGSMALRDMLTGGFVWVGRTANGLSGPTAFNGRLPVDPRTIPPVPGMSYILSGPSPKAMLARAMFEPDWYDWVRDEQDRPIGYPAVLPEVTVATFGGAYAKWVKAAKAGEQWVPDEPAAGGSADASLRAMDAVLLVLAKANDPLDMDGLDGELRRRGIEFSRRTLRDALSKLRKADPPLVQSQGGKHWLTQRGVEEALTQAELVTA